VKKKIVGKDDHAEFPKFGPLLLDFADNNQKGMRHQIRGETQAQQGMTLRKTLLY
jgi:hypothetical protein